MKQNTFESLIGLCVLVTAMVFLYFMTAGRSALGTTGSYTLNALFYNAEGISVGGDVKMAGVKIGNVIGMDLLPDTYQAKVVIEVDEKVKIPTDSEVNVASDGLLGGSFIEVVAGADEATFGEGDSFSMTNDSVSLINLLASFATKSQGEE